jgi:ribonuclease HII
MLIKSVQAYIEKEDSKKLKQKQRERMQPKMGKMDIDYQVLFYLGYQISYRLPFAAAFK